MTERPMDDVMDGQAVGVPEVPEPAIEDLTADGARAESVTASVAWSAGCRPSASRSSAAGCGDAAPSSS